MIKQLMILINTMLFINSAFCDLSKAESTLDFVAHNLTGRWIGKLNLSPIMDLTLIFDLSEDVNHNLLVKLSCLEQSINDLPVELFLQGGELLFDMKKLGAHFKGHLIDGQKIQGQFEQNGKTLPLILTKGLAPKRRPQEPNMPYPYDVEEVKFHNFKDQIILAGTLTLPLSKDPSPAVLLIAGSGPIDRDETIFGHKLFLVLADHLTRQGIAVLRVDKRGVGESTGNFDNANSQDFASDAIAGINYLKTRKEINVGQIGLIGHSEGGLIASMVAAKINEIAFVVLMAGTGVQGEDILYRQGMLLLQAAGLKEDEIEKNSELQKQIFTLLKNEPNSDKAKEALVDIVAKHLFTLGIEDPQTQKSMEEEVGLYNSAWFRYFLTYDPTTSLKQLKAPALVLNGELDLQVCPKQNIPVIEKSLQEA